MRSMTPNDPGCSYVPPRTGGPLRLSEPRTTYETEWYGKPVTCCSWCSFSQGDDGEPNHALWCDRDAGMVAGGEVTA
jgi:hypothetical protein